MLYRIQAKGTFKSIEYCGCEFCPGHDDIAQIAIDEEIEALDAQCAHEELREMIVEVLLDQSANFYARDEDDWKAIRWKIEPSVRAVPETVLLERAGYATLFAMENNNA